MHCDVFSHVAVEYIWRQALTMTFGFPVEAFKPTHNANHHVFTGLEEDHNATSQVAYRWHWLNLLLFFPTVYPKIAQLETAYVKKEFAKRSWNFYRFVVQTIGAHAPCATSREVGRRRTRLGGGTLYNDTFKVSFYKATVMDR